MKPCTADMGQLSVPVLLLAFFMQYNLVYMLLKPDEPAQGRALPLPCWQPECRLYADSEG